MKDPYSSNNKAINRLVSEWQEHGSIVIGVDQDDTLYDYHSQGFTFDRTVSILKQAQSAGCTLCAWTADDREDYITTYWKSIGLRMDYFNDSPVNCGKISRKPYFNILLDDRAGLKASLNILENVIRIMNERMETTKRFTGSLPNPPR